MSSADGFGSGSGSAKGTSLPFHVVFDGQQGGGGFAGGNQDTTGTRRFAPPAASAAAVTKPAYQQPAWTQQQPTMDLSAGEREMSRKYLATKSAAAETPGIFGDNDPNLTTQTLPMWK